MHRPRGASSSPIAGQRALVWGACGFIGRHLVSRLLSEQAAVTVLCGSVPAVAPAWREAVEWLTVEKTNPSERVLRQALRSVDVVYNLAGTSSAIESARAPLSSLDETCRAQLLFLDACAERPSPHVVFVSTRLVYAPAGDRAMTEQAPLEPRSIYAAHKLCVEHYHRIAAARARVTVAILRVSPVFGHDEAHEDEPRGIIDTFIKRSLRGEPIQVFGDGHQLRDFIYVDDLVDVLLAASAAPAARNAVFNVGAGESIRLRDAAEIVRVMTGGPPVRYEPWPEEYAAMETGDSILDISKARDCLGLSPRHSFERGVALTIEAMTHSTVR